jgi:hypothetical protein
MPYQRVEPVPVSLMLKKRYHGHFTICEKLREIYLATDNEEIKLNCRIAMAQAKRMHERLKKYKAETSPPTDTQLLTDPEVETH